MFMVYIAVAGRDSAGITSYTVLDVLIGIMRQEFHELYMDKQSGLPSCSLLKNFYFSQSVDISSSRLPFGNPRFNKVSNPEIWALKYQADEFVRIGPGVLDSNEFSCVYL